MAFDPEGALYVVDSDNQRLRRIDRQGVISTVAGTGVMGHTGDGGRASKATLDSPFGVVVDRDGNVLVTEEEDGAIRRIGGDGVIETIAGGGTASPGDGGLATDAKLHDLTGLTIDAHGTILVADFLDCRVRSIATDGTIATVAGDGSCDHRGDEGPATRAGLRFPIDVAVGPDGDVFILEHIDPDSGYVRRVDASGTIHDVALDVHLREPMGMAVIGSRLYITNRDDARIVSIALP
jgi:DNA-binding beta-propeller fold protein YncE